MKKLLLFIVLIPFFVFAEECNLDNIVVDGVDILNKSCSLIVNDDSYID